MGLADGPLLLTTNVLLLPQPKSSSSERKTVFVLLPDRQPWKTQKHNNSGEKKKRGGRGKKAERAESRNSERLISSQISLKPWRRVTWICKQGEGKKEEAKHLLSEKIQDAREMLLSNPESPRAAGKGISRLSSQRNETMQRQWSSLTPLLPALFLLLKTTRTE